MSVRDPPWSITLRLSPTNKLALVFCPQVISEHLSLLVNLTGIIDIEQEIQRLSKEKERLGPAIEQYQRKINAPGYESKVPETVRATNAEKVTDESKAELSYPI